MVSLIRSLTDPLDSMASCTKLTNGLYSVLLMKMEPGGSCNSRKNLIVVAQPRKYPRYLCLEEPFTSCGSFSEPHRSLVRLWVSPCLQNVLSLSSYTLSVIGFSYEGYGAVTDRSPAPVGNRYFHSFFIKRTVFERFQCRSVLQ